MTIFVRSTLSFVRYCRATRVAGVIVLATVGWLSGQVPGLSPDFSRLTVTSTASAQNKLQIIRYAQAVLQIEPLRIQTQERIQAMMGRRVPGDLCRQRGILLPSNVRKACEHYHNRSAEIIRNNRLSLWEFNHITWESQSKPWLKNQIQQELLRQQR